MMMPIKWLEEASFHLTEAKYKSSRDMSSQKGYFAVGKFEHAAIMSLNSYGPKVLHSKLRQGMTLEKFGNSLARRG